MDEFSQLKCDINKIYNELLEKEEKKSCCCGEEKHECNCSKEKKEAINHPSHYNAHTIEVIDITDDWELNFNLGNVIKYTLRAPYKNNKLEDLKKAAWYLNREIENEENKRTR